MLIKDYITTVLCPLSKLPHSAVSLIILNT